MAGTLTISTLSDGTNSTSSTNCIQGSAKAWVKFNGVTTTTINASYNVSSITRNATGDYTVNFTNAFSDTNYAAFVSLGLTSPTNWPASAVLNTDASVNTDIPSTTTAIRFGVAKYNATVNLDVKYCYFAAFR